MTLDRAELHKSYIVDICADQQLSEVGFLKGEQVRVIARAVFNGPIAVRIGTSTFAIRLDEARQISIKPLTA